MPRLFIGRDSTGVGCIKVMKNNTDNPYSTSDTDYSKFYFNSKWDMQIKFVASDSFTWVNTDTYFYYPAGSTNANYQKANFATDLQWNAVVWKNVYFQNQGDLDYDFPVFDIREQNPDGRYSYGRFDENEYNNGTQTSSIGRLEEGWVQNADAGVSGYINISLGLVSLTRGAVDRRVKRVTVWNLPADQAAFVNPAKAPVAGQSVVQINSSACRVAKPGYSASSSIASQLAFNSESRPAKVIASGDVAVPTGTTTISFAANLTGINVSGELIADVIQYRGANIVFPTSLPNDGEGVYGAYYQIVGQTIVFTNPGSAVRARYLILSQDNTAASSGSNRVFRQLTIAGNDVFQFLRPGAAATPNLADVIIDSRWPCLQIIKTGTFTIPNGAGAVTNIPFSSTGLFPFVKYYTIHGSGQLNSTFSRLSATKRVRYPWVSRGFASNPDNGNRVTWICGDTTFCTLSANNAAFTTYKGNPYRLYFTQNSNNQYVQRTEDIAVPAHTIRYYIFGIPA